MSWAEAVVIGIIAVCSSIVICVVVFVAKKVILTISNNKKQVAESQINSKKQVAELQLEYQKATNNALIETGRTKAELFEYTGDKFYNETASGAEKGQKRRTDQTKQENMNVSSFLEEMVKRQRR